MLLSPQVPSVAAGIFHLHLKTMTKTFLHLPASTH